MVFFIGQGYFSLWNGNAMDSFLLLFVKINGWWYDYSK